MTETTHAQEIQRFGTLRRHRCPVCLREWREFGIEGAPDWSTPETIASAATQAAIAHGQKCIENAPRGLVHLAAEANRLHAEARAHAESAVEAAVACGKVLLEAKATVEHGQWSGWLAERFDGSARTARAYMQVAKKLPANWQHAADLTSLRGALELVAETREPAIANDDPSYQPDLPIEDVRVGLRLRQSVGDLAGLIESIEHVGLIIPIVVTEDMRLICGWRRLEACKRLGWRTIPARIFPNVIEDEIRAAERDENELRKDYTVTEKLRAHDGIMEAQA